MGEEYDPAAVKARYLAERDKRLVPGRAAIRDLATDEHFAAYRADPFTPLASREAIVDEADVVIVGGGIAGVLAGVHLRKAGVERIRIVDQAGGVGGTWYWNRYPGVMCDVESYIYIPMLEELDHVPSERYASGEEIRRCLEALAQEHDLVADGLFHTGVTAASWDDDAHRWRVSTDRGDELSCRYYVLAVGILNLMKLPTIPGMERFAGRSFHTARWDYAYTGGGPNEPLTALGDKVVGLVGTGASGIQCLPPLAEAAKHVYVFQRTPSAIGVRGNGPTDPTFAERRTSGWQQPGWTTSSRSCSAARSTRTSPTTAGPSTTPRSTTSGRLKAPPSPTTCASPRRSTSGSWRSIGAASPRSSPTRPPPRPCSRSTATSASGRASTTSTWGRSTRRT